MDSREKDRQKASSMAISLIKSLDDCITEGNSCKVKQLIERELLIMAEYKDNEFEGLINSLPTHVKELINNE